MADLSTITDTVLAAEPLDDASWVAHLDQSDREYEQRARARGIHLDDQSDREAILRLFDWVTDIAGQHVAAVVGDDESAVTDEVMREAHMQGLVLAHRLAVVCAMRERAGR
ncbi:hypothetical protein ER308_07300 [Egibacter rhizosphaerae]|uniref:Uncharacterized protein n=1 Tax=Egibacter rhizosphaerae TaxID=1670831 RepID=A0A411YDU7_9ACTN|nr:hypothetical protein [Egibacter rhizosphaerae]QBI19371.1 hypothetical protein ER308_07300 [Egibacter rhizosphaerae]